MMTPGDMPSNDRPPGDAGKADPRKALGGAAVAPGEGGGGLDKASVLARLFKRFRPYITAQRLPLALAALCMVLAAVMEIIRPWPMKLIFDGILMPAAETGPPHPGGG